MRIGARVRSLNRNPFNPHLTVKLFKFRGYEKGRMMQFKLTGFRFNNLQWIAEKATQKMVLYLQPETKKN